MQLASEIADYLTSQPDISRLASLILNASGDTEDEFMTRELTLDEMAGPTSEMVYRHLYKFAETGAIQQLHRAKNHYPGYVVETSGNIKRTRESPAPLRDTNPIFKNNS